MFSIFMECFKSSMILQKHILWSAVCTLREFLMEYNWDYFAKSYSPAACSTSVIVFSGYFGPNALIMHLSKKKTTL